MQKTESNVSGTLNLSNRIGSLFPEPLTKGEACYDTLYSHLTGVEATERQARSVILSGIAVRF